MKQYTMDELVEIAINEGYKLTQIVRGYEVFKSDYMNGAIHIEKLDCVDKFESDKEASEQAEKDGIKIIKDLPISSDDEDFGYFIDTTENREIISKHLESRGIEFDCSRVRVVRIFFEDGDYLTTKIIGTKKEIGNYYTGKMFNLGIVEDRMVRVAMIEFIE